MLNLFYFPNPWLYNFTGKMNYSIIVLVAFSIIHTVVVQAQGDTWPLSEEKVNTEKLAELEKAIADEKFRQISSVVIIKKEELLWEGYFNGWSPDNIHDTRSVGKTFASAVLGIAIAEGHIKSLDQTLGDFYKIREYANYSPKKEAVKLRDLLTMSSAFKGSDNDPDSPGNEGNMYDRPDWVKWALNLPMDTNKENGKQWDYFTAGVVLLGDILDKKVPGGLEAYAHEKLFKPLGIKKHRWQYTPMGVANTAGGLRMTAREYARFGQLYQNKGRWNGKQIIPEDWVAASFTKHQKVNPNGSLHYGYLWWNKSYYVQDNAYEVFACNGNGGNKIFVFTGQPWVVVITATAYGQSYAHPQADEMMEQYIIPAILNK
jgi:CubicO group peptidase (beta-lactamase class C family)